MLLLVIAGFDNSTAEKQSNVAESNPLEQLDMLKKIGQLDKMDFQNKLTQLNAFLMIPLSQSIEDSTEFLLEYPILDVTENGDILLVGKNNGEKVSLAKIGRQQVLDDWAKIHDAFFTLCKQRSDAGVKESEQIGGDFGRN